MNEYIHKIDDPNAPERLKGKIITAFLNEKQLKFEMDMPDNPTPNEMGYFKWLIGEVVEDIQNKTGIQMPPGRIEKTPG